jgi:hypothetical protein
MLAHLIGVVCPILLVAQAVLFFAFRWERVESETIGGGTLMRWSISPWIVWLSVGIVMFAVMLATTCRGHVQRWHRWAVGMSLAVGIAVAAWGLALEAPPDAYHPPVGRERDRW